MNFIESNIIIALKYIKIIHSLIDKVYSADILISQNADESKKCNYDYFMWTLAGFENQYFKKDFTFQILAYVYYDLIESKSSCGKLSVLLFNLLNNDKDFKYKSKLKIIGNRKIDHCVLLYEDLDRSIIFDPWLFYYMPERTDLLISDFEYFFFEIEKIKELSGGADDWTYAREQIYANNIKFPILIKDDEDKYVINHNEIKEFLVKHEHEYDFILEKFKILEKSRIRNKKGPH